MKKIKLCLHQENLSSGALTHSLRNTAKYIDRNQFELYLATTDVTCYGPEVLKQFAPENVFVYRREPGWMYEYIPATGEYPAPPEEHPLYDWLAEKQIDIIHDQRAGQAFFPLNSPKVTAKKIEYNVFAGYDATPDIARTLCISQGVYNDLAEQHQRRGTSHLISRLQMLNPAVSIPETTDDMRAELGISADMIVIGRSSNPGRGDTANFQAYARIQSDKTIFVTPELSQDQLQLMKDLNIRNAIVLPLITNYYDMSRYYNTIDINAHNRGESFGASVAESHTHAVPVVTFGWSRHQFTPATAHEELIWERDYCSDGPSYEAKLNEYCSMLNRLIHGGRAYCKSEGKRFQARANQIWAAPVIVKQLERIYRDVLGY